MADSPIISKYLLATLILMQVKHKTLSAVLLLFGWLSLQTVALHHEFSAEHLLSPANHVCISQAIHLDDLVDGQESTQFVVLQIDSVNIVTSFCRIDSQASYTPHSPRAPPTLNS